MFSATYRKPVRKTLLPFERIVRPFLIVLGNVCFGVFLQIPSHPIKWAFVVLAILNAPAPGWYDTLRFALARKKLQEAARAIPDADQPATSNSLEDAPRPRVGLVLSGGGGKGAYHVGVIEALRAAGVRIDAIAGTSIGALNGTLVVSSGPALTRNVWEKLTTWCLIREGLGIWRLLIWPINIAANLARIIVADTPRNLGPIVRRNYVVFGVAAIGHLAFLAFVAPVLALPTTVSRSIAVVWIVFFAVQYFLFFVWVRINPALISSRGLRDLISASVDAATVAQDSTRVFVTLASVERMMNPDDAALIKELRTSGYDSEEIELIADEVSGSSELVPRYFELSQLSATEIADLLVASMALPLGLLPAVRIREKLCVDGGRADNTPLLPLLSLGCEVIYVVHLTPVEYESATKDLCDKASRHLDSQRRSGEQMPSAWRGVPISPVRSTIVHICPTSRLGPPLFSTIWFSRRKTETLIKRGLQDAQVALNRTIPRAVEQPKRSDNC